MAEDNGNNVFAAKFQSAGISVDENAVNIPAKEKKPTTNGKKKNGVSSDERTDIKMENTTVTIQEKMRQRLAELKKRATVDEEDVSIYNDARGELNRIESDLAQLDGIQSELVRAAVQQLNQERDALLADISAVQQICPNILIEAAKLEARRIREASAEKVREQEEKKEQELLAQAERYLIAKEEIPLLKKYAAPAHQLLRFLSGNVQQSSIFLAVDEGEILISRVNDEESEFSVSQVTTSSLAQKIFKTEKGEWVERWAFVLPDGSKNLRPVQPDFLRRVLIDEVKAIARQIGERQAQKDEEKKEQEAAKPLVEIGSIKNPISWAELRLGKKGIVPVSVPNWEYTDENGNRRKATLTFQWEACSAEGGVPGFMLREATPNTLKAASFLKDTYGKATPVEKLQEDKRLQAIYNLNEEHETGWILEKMRQDYNATNIFSEDVEILLGTEKVDQTVSIIGFWYQKQIGGRPSQKHAVGIILERSGDEVKITAVVPGFSEKLFNEQIGKSYKISDLPVPLRSFLRTIYSRAKGIDREAVPDHLKPAVSREENGNHEEAS